MKTPFRAPSWVILFLLPLLAGMGSIFGEEQADKIPAPERKFEAVFLDQMDVATACTSVSIQGNTFVEGKQGEGTYTIPFDRIREIEFLMKGNELRGIVRMKKGGPVELVLNVDHRAYGKTAYGTFQIRIGDLKKMSFPGEETGS